MRIPSRAISGDIGFNMTPMIDVVFLLIIFFLLSSHLAKREKQLPLSLPAAASGREQQPDHRPRLTINVLADGTLVVASRPMAPEDLVSLFRDRRALHGDRLEVRIRGDRGVRYSRVEPILFACVRAGIWNVGFAVQQKK